MDKNPRTLAVPLRVLALLPDVKTIGGCTFVRLTGPLAKLQQKGYAAEWMAYPVARNMALTGRGNLTSYDVIVMARAGDTGDGRLITLVKLLCATGSVVIWETDDDYTNEHRIVLKGDANAVMNASTAITVSTKHLREQCARFTTRPIYLLPNTIDFDFWDHVAQIKRTVPGPSIGLVGTLTHYSDWSEASDALHLIGQNYPDVHFVVGGMLPDYLQDLPNLHHLEFVPYTGYPNMVHQIDIGLCPLKADDEFNKSKSAIKALEYWTGGAAVVASDCSVYQTVMPGGGDGRGFLASTTEDWYRSIKTYLDSPQVRLKHAMAGRKWVRSNRNMEYNAMFWWDVYTEVYAKHGGTLDERIITEWQMGTGPTVGKGRGRQQLLPISRSESRRGRSNPHRTNAPRGRRRGNGRRSPQARRVLRRNR